MKCGSTRGTLKRGREASGKAGAQLYLHTSSEWHSEGQESFVLTIVAVESAAVDLLVP